MKYSKKELENLELRRLVEILIDEVSEQEVMNKIRKKTLEKTNEKKSKNNSFIN